METRIFHTRFWMDSYVLSLDINEKIFFVYLITNERNNLIGCYELPDELMQFHLRLNLAEIERIKKKLEDDRKVLFMNSWVYLVNHDKYQSYKGEKNDIAKEKQWARVPGFVKEKINTLSVPYRYPSDTTRNKKSEIRNKKSEKGRGSGGREIPTRKAYAVPSEQVTEVVAHWRAYLEGLTPDESSKNTRRNGATFIKRMRKAIQAKGGDESRAVEMCKTVIDALMADDFHGPNATSMGYIIRNASKVIRRNQQSQSQVLDLDQEQL